MLLFALFILIFWNGTSHSLHENTDSSNWKIGSTLAEDPPFQGCEFTPQIPKSKISKFVVNLDLPPQKRWSEVVRFKQKEIKNLLASIKNQTNELFSFNVFDLVDRYLPLLAKSLPLEYYQELVGISREINIPLGEVTLFNVFYEFFSACTSIVMEGNDGRMYHGRNLDFGLFLGWDIKNNTWLTSEYLKPLVVNLDFIQSNKTVFSSINFAGYIGVLTAVKKNAFSLTVNERFVINGGYIGILEWILGFKNMKWMGIFTRDIMLKAPTYTQAQKMLIKEPLVAPVYFILAGNKSHQASVITRGRKNFDIWSFGEKHQGQVGGWYLVQTNYDHWKEAPFYDDRRSPAITCMDKNNRSTPFNTLMNVLSTRPILNKLTTYTALMEVKSGLLYAKLQKCENPCWPW